MEADADTNVVAARTFSEFSGWGKTHKKGDYEYQWPYIQEGGEIPIPEIPEFDTFLTSPYNTIRPRGVGERDQKHFETNRSVVSRKKQSQS